MFYQWSKIASSLLIWLAVVFGVSAHCHHHCGLLYWNVTACSTSWARGWALASAADVHNTEPAASWADEAGARHGAGPGDPVTLQPAGGAGRQREGGGCSEHWHVERLIWEQKFQGREKGGGGCWSSKQQWEQTFELVLNYIFLLLKQIWMTVIISFSAVGGGLDALSNLTNSKQR